MPNRHQDGEGLEVSAKQAEAPDSPPHYQFIEGDLESVQLAANDYHGRGYRVITLTAVRVRGSGVGATPMNEYCLALEREG